MPAKPTPKPTLKNRILKYGTKPADQFLANPKNPRVHPIQQREAMHEALGEVGFVLPVVETVDGYLLDGHERIYQALINNDEVPYVVVDIHSENAEADYVLATLDALGAMATYDAKALDELLQGMEIEGESVQKMLNELWDTYSTETYTDAAVGVRPDEKLDIYLNATIKQIVILLPNEQYDNVIARLETARQQAGVESNTELFLKMLEAYEQDTSAAEAF